MGLTKRQKRQQERARAAGMTEKDISQMRSSRDRKQTDTPKKKKQSLSNKVKEMQKKGMSSKDINTQINKLQEGKPSTSLGPTQHLEAPKKEEKESILGTIGKAMRGENIKIAGKTIKTGLGEEVKEGKLIAGTAPAFGFGSVGKIAQGAALASKINRASKLKAISAAAIKREKHLISIGKAFPRNIKTTKQVNSILKKVFSAKTMLILGGAASSMFFGQWGQAEAGEPITFQMNKILKDAEETGDWNLYDEAIEARSELTNLESWEKILMWTPASPFMGITNKIKGVIAGGVIMDKVAEDIKIKQETGETDDKRWKRIAAEKAEAEKASVDYYNSERKKLLKWEEEAKDRDMKEDAAFWRKEREAQYKKEAEDREAIAKFWMAYKKESYKLSQDSRPSNLNFGLL